MLHFAILPHHRRWARFFARLAFVILDEVHAYRGIFGSHVGLVLRRLQRICRVHGSRPQIIGASATIANALELGVDIGGLKSVVNARRWGRCRLEFGDAGVTTRYTRFVKRAFQPRRTLGGGAIDLPPQVLTTEALRLHLSASSETLDDRYGLITVTPACWERPISSSV